MLLTGVGWAALGTNPLARSVGRMESVSTEPTCFTAQRFAATVSPAPLKRRPLARFSGHHRDAERPSSYRNYRVIRPWLTSTFDELIVYCRTTLLLSKKITSDFLSPSAPLWIKLT